MTHPKQPNDCVSLEGTCLQVGLADVDRMSASNPIEEEQPVQMVDLVLQCARFIRIRRDDDLRTSPGYPASNRHARSSLQIAGEVWN